MADNLKDLPAIPHGTEPALKNALDRMREALQTLRSNRGDPLDAAVTWRTAIANGLARVVGGGASGTGSVGGTPIAAGGSSSTTDSVTPDLTPPPTVSGLTVTAGLTNVIVQFDPPVYSQGHGNQRTDIYAVKRDPASGAAAPTFTDAALVDSVAGSSPIIAIPSNLNVKWFVWAKYVSTDGVASTAPAGGTNGVQATTGTIGNSDLGPLIVTADKISQGAYPGLNIIPNGGSEDGTVCWQSVETSGAGGTLSIDTSTKTGGSSSFKITKPSTSDGCGIGSNAVPVIPGETYSVKLKAKGSSATSSGFWVIMNELATKPGIGYVTTAAATSRSFPLNNGPIATAWTSYEFTYTVPAGVYWATLEIVTWLPGPLSLWFDDVQMGRQITASSIAANSITVGTAAIQNGAIVNAMIGTAAIDDAKIANVAAGKLTAGSVGVGEYIQSTGFVSGSSGWKINGNGVAEFSGVIVRGTIVASGGSIGGATIAASYVQSVSYVANSAGWKLDNASGIVYAASLHVQDSTGTRIVNTDATGTAYALQFGTNFWVKANGDAYFGGTLAVGTASKGAATGTGSSSSANASSAVSVPTSNIVLLTYTTNGSDALVTMSVTVALMANTSTPGRLYFVPLLDGGVYGTQFPEVELGLVQSNPMQFAAGSGATAYNWGMTHTFTYTLVIPGSSLAAGSHTFGCQITGYFYNGSGSANIITGSSIYAKGTATIREFIA